MRAFFTWLVNLAIAAVVVLAVLLLMAFVGTPHDFD
jgi:hypothetical protein